MQKKANLYTPLRELKFNKSYAWDVVSTGFPAFLHSLLASITNTMHMNLMKKYSDAAVAAIGITRKIEHTFGQVVIGINQGIIPLISYNFASGNNARLTQVRKKSIILSLSWSFISILILIPFAKQFMMFFINDEATIAIGIPIVIMFSFMPLAMAYNSNARTTLQALGKKRTSTIFSVVRQIVIFVPLMYIMDRIFELYGTVSASVLTDFIADILAFFMLRKVFREINLNEDKKMLEI